MLGKCLMSVANLLKGKLSHKQNVLFKGPLVLPRLLLCFILACSYECIPDLFSIHHRLRLSCGHSLDMVWYWMVSGSPIIRRSASWFRFYGFCRFGNRPLYRWYRSTRLLSLDGSQNRTIRNGRWKIKAARNARTFRPIHRPRWFHSHVRSGLARRL